MGAVFDWRHDMTVRGGIGPSMLEIGLRSGQPCFFNSLFSTCLADYPAWVILKSRGRTIQFGGMKHVDMRKLPAAAQEERRRQVVGLREGGMTYDAIAAQVGLTRTGVFDICRRFAEQGAAGLASGPRGPAPGTDGFSSPAGGGDPRSGPAAHA